MTAYQEFLQSKVPPSLDTGFDVDPREVHPLLKPHQRDIVCWAVKKGRAAIFAAFGLGKSVMQLEIARLVLEKVAAARKQEDLFPFCRFLIVAPLGVRQEFKRDAAMIGLDIKFVRRFQECEETGLYLTNYETIRDGKMDPRQFTGVSLDEAGILRGFGGTKTFRKFMQLFEGTSIYRFVATATPSPNEFIELLAYAGFLDVMDIGQAKTRFFKRDSTKADVLTIHPHKEREFWLWVSTWAIFLQKPSDLGYSDAGYDLPEVEIHWHELPSDYQQSGFESNGQGRLVNNSAIGVTHAAREKRASLVPRIEKLLELRALDPGAHRIIWHDLEDERRAIEKAVPEIVTVYGKQDDEDKEAAIIGFSEGEVTELGGKLEMLGVGCNFQRHCAWAIYFGINFKFHAFIQGFHRIVRYLQTKKVRVDLIYTEAEREIRRTLERKWAQHVELVQQMTAIIRQYGLATNAMQAELRRSFGVNREEERGDTFTLVKNDSVIETSMMPADYADLILTSIPFSTQYEYSPSYNDFGHCDDNPHFFRQFDFLTPELFRILKPGRVAAIHVKDRIVPGGMTGLGFQTVYPFHCDTIAHFIKHGFAYLGMKTIVTDVVRENNQTYRLGWTEQCKDGSRMGVGMPEYLLLFRKPPTDSSDGYADLPVVKDKEKYSRSRWQIDAHGFMRSSGNRLLCSSDLVNLPHEKIFKLFREFSKGQVYDYEKHVGLGEALEVARRLPVTFMLLQPQSWHPDVWTDITRMLTLNGAQSAAGREMHLCPMQFDLADRVITQFTMKGEVVFDPFAGLGTVPLRAVKLGRYGHGIELSPSYYLESIRYLKGIEQKMATPCLFDMDVLEEEITA